jgi:hypothetical protein
MKRKLKRILCWLGFHSENCRRRIFTEENTYLCITTGSIYKKLNYGKLFTTFKKSKV